MRSFVVHDDRRLGAHPETQSASVCRAVNESFLGFEISGVPNSVGMLTLASSIHKEGFPNQVPNWGGFPFRFAFETVVGSQISRCVLHVAR